MPHTADRDVLAKRLHAASPLVNPSLLLCDFAHLADEIEAIEVAGAQLLHLDVMDGQFVPNITYGMTIVRAARSVTALPLDVHLMMFTPELYIADFREAGADILTIHLEAVDDAAKVLQQIRDSGALAGLAINPPTPLDGVVPLLPLCDLVLCMSVMAGFGGQRFDPVALTKLRALRDEHGYTGLLEIDGGVNRDTVARCATAGTDLLVAGSAIFSQPDYTAAITELDRLARQS